MYFAIYTRVSTEEQVHGYSLADQKEACIEKCIQLGANVKDIKVFSDEGVSGTIIDRPGISSLRDAVKNGDVAYIVVRDPDRLSRKLSHQLILTEEFEKNGAKLQFVNFDWKDTPEGRLFYSVRGAIAEYEREKIKERTTQGKIQKAKQGGIPVRFEIYGYDYDPETGKVSINENEAEIVRQIFEMFIEKDMSYIGLARYLNKKEVPTKRNKSGWHRQVVKQIITNTAYMGIWHYRKRRINNGKVEMRDEDEWIAVKIPVIIDKETFIKAQDKVAEARRLYNRKSKMNYLLSGIISCGDCGNTMTGVYANWWGEKHRRYTCDKNDAMTKNYGCRPRKMIMADIVEDAVWNQVKKWINNPELILKEAMKHRPQNENIKKEMKKLNEQLTKIQKGKNNILSTIASGLVELDEETKKILDDTKRREVRIKNRIIELEEILKGIENSKFKIEEIKKITSDILDKDNLSFEEKKELVRLLVKQVIINGRQTPGKKLGNIEITIIAKVSG